MTSDEDAAAGAPESGEDAKGVPSASGPYGFMNPSPALEGLADDLRGLLDSALAARPSDPGYADDMAWAAERLREVTHRLSRHAPVTHEVAFGVGEDAVIEAERAGRRPYYVRGPVIGTHNPVHPVIHREVADGVTKGTVRFTVSHEGPPGCVHGGVVSMLFDVLLGQHVLDQGIPGMTGQLSVRYLRPTPLYTSLSFEVRMGETEGRKMHAHGSLSADGETTATADGLFILPRTGYSA